MTQYMPQLCLPRCRVPSFPEPCGGAKTVCCIEWTMPCGESGEPTTLRWDGAFVLLPPYSTFFWGSTFMGGALERPWDGDTFCFTNLAGTTAWYGLKTAVCEPFEDRHSCANEGWVSNGRSGYTPDPEVGPCYAVGGYDDDAPSDSINNSISICGVDDVVGAESAGCTVWPDFLTELSGFVEGPTTTVTYNSDSEEWSKETVTYHAKPYIKWGCTGFNRILWEVGWEVFGEHYVSGPFETEPDTSPVEPDVLECLPASLIMNSYWSHCGAYPISTGETMSDWYSLAAPFELQNSVGTGGDTFNSTITPIICAYEPCGESIDCFADCISGTKDCDGTTPAHKPVIYITFDTNSADCCISGTFAMQWTGAKYEITDPPSCLVEGCLITIEAELRCAYVDAGGPSYDYGPMTNTAVLIIRTVDGSGCVDVQAVYIVGLTCSGGLLNNTSGTIYMDMVCNDSHETDLDWVLHG